MLSDQLNGCFEFVGGIMVSLSVYRLYRDKEVKGISIWPILFFTGWGFFNLYLYPSVGLWWSFWGGWMPLLANLVWLAMFWYYRKPKPVEVLGFTAGDVVNIRDYERLRDGARTRHMRGEFQRCLDAAVLRAKARVQQLP